LLQLGKLRLNLLAIGTDFSFSSRADAIFFFKPDKSTPIAIGALNLELRSQFHQFLFVKLFQF
jgi:hypothetical protein